MMGTEADVHFEFYRHLANAIEENPERGQLSFGKPTPEKRVNGGFADILIPDKRGNPLVVIEAKKQINGGYRRGIDPYSPEVIRQAHTYASQLGADYFATFNGRLLVLFETFESGIPLLQRKSRAYRIRDLATFASSFLDEVAAVQSKKLRWDPADTAFVGRLASFHDRLCAVMDSEVGSRLNARIKEWVKTQGWELEEDEALVRFIAQAAYLYMNKIVFHKILRDQGKYPLPKLHIPPNGDVQTILAKAYLQVVNEIDFEAIYQHDPLFDEVPLSNDAVIESREFIEELESYDLSSFDRDVIGRIYERVIPEDERRALGQYYTPPDVIELITHLSIQNPECKVLDPACGSGGFLVASYNRLKETRNKHGLISTHADLINRVYGVDINRFPAHLSAINLSIRNLVEKTNIVNIEINDFFHVKPGQHRPWGERGTSGGSESACLRFPKEFNAILANPPYIRHERIPDKELCRKHLKDAIFGGTKPNLDPQSDIYCYFFTHGYEFLAKKGRMGFITSNMWLAVQYGQGLRGFFLDRFRVLAVVQFWKRAFEGQLVPTCVTVLEECSDPKERDKNLVKFVMIRGALPLKELLRLIERKDKPNTIISTESARTLSVPQQMLSADQPWHRYLLGPPVYWQLLASDKLVPLGKGINGRKPLASATYGEKTGCNEFFILSPERAKELGLATRYFEPFYGSPKEMVGIQVSGEPPAYLLSVGELVGELLKTDHQLSKETRKEILAAEKEGDEEYARYADEARLKDKQMRKLRTSEIRAIGLLKEKGHEALYSYVLWGIRQGYHARPCLSSNSIWFVMREKKTGRLFAMQNVRGRPHFPITVEPASVVNTMYLLTPRREEDLPILAAYLNSSIGKLFFEVHGRIQYGGLVRVFVDDLDEFPVLNPEALTVPEKKRIVEAFNRLIVAGEHEDKSWDLLLELDRAILAPMGLENHVEEVAKVAKALCDSRQEQKEYESPVEAEQIGSFEISGGSRLGTHRQFTLD